jgi:hypothetical protein
MPPEIVDQRLQEQLPHYQALRHRDFTMRIGQALEIAVYRTLLQQDFFHFFGGFRDLNDHDDSTTYAKIEPPSAISGNTLPNKESLDFILDRKGVFAGIESQKRPPLDVS